MIYVCTFRCRVGLTGCIESLIWPQTQTYFSGPLRRANVRSKWFETTDMRNTSTNT